MKQRKSDNRMNQQRSKTSYSADQYRGVESDDQSGMSGDTGAVKRPAYQRWWFWLLIVVVIAAGASMLGEGEPTSPSDSSSTLSEIGDGTTGKQHMDSSLDASGSTGPTGTSELDTTASSESSEGPTTGESSDELIDPDDRVFVLAAGHYTAGIDLPSGRCDVCALSGEGNLSSTNMFSGGINEMFGIDDGSGFYVETFSGLTLPEGTVLSVGGTLMVEMTYSQIDTGYSGRLYDEQSTIELTSGNFIAGEDFPAGIYSIEAVSGQGNLSSSNMFSEGVNEMFGVDDGSGFYLPRIEHVRLSDGTELSASSGVVIRLIPVIGE